MQTLKIQSPVGQGADPREFLEGTAEIIGVAESQVIGYFLYGKPGVDQHILTQLNLVIVQIGDVGGAHALAESFHKMRGGQSRYGGELPDGRILRIVRIQVGENIQDFPVGNVELYMFGLRHFSISLCGDDDMLQQSL